MITVSHHSHTQSKFYNPDLLEKKAKESEIKKEPFESLEAYAYRAAHTKAVQLRGYAAEEFLAAAINEAGTQIAEWLTLKGQDVRVVNHSSIYLKYASNTANADSIKGELNRAKETATEPEIVIAAWCYSTKRKSAEALFEYYGMAPAVYTHYNNELDKLTEYMYEYFANYFTTKHLSTNVSKSAT